MTRLNLEDRWPSLADQVTVATTLFGDAGERLVSEWLDTQLGLVGDAEFAAVFADHITLPGIAPLDYAHRHIRTPRGELLGGIRFYGRDVARPFVDVLAHSFTDLSVLADVVAAEWSAFGVRFLRLQHRPGIINGGNVILDQTIHVARYSQMTPTDGRVRLAPLPDAGSAIDLVAARYADLAAANPELAGNIAGQEAEEIEEWHRSGRLRGIDVDGTIVGLLAVDDSNIGWITGDEVKEEVIASGHSGHGYAASAQAAWAAHVADDPARLLIGTIDRHNHASRRTAERAGRPAVLENVFVYLGLLDSRTPPLSESPIRAPGDLL